MILTITPSGETRCVYTEALELDQLGSPSITAHISHVDPDENGQWWADLSPVNGPTLGPFARKSEAIRAEVSWIEEHAL